MDKAQLQGLANLHPLRKIGELQDIVGLVLHLANGGDRFVSGQTLFVDGAITAGSHAS
ncbi:hypothetical protein JCM19236_6648 [Vibrio sp. JCM 19236]|nr:hypothetical protein JCM19236_6648 [Vibrio sp. JCM 19236]